jgi:uncharacterized membrane protein YdjX (TVP38/TMEM64 family)
MPRVSRAALLRAVSLLAVLGIVVLVYSLRDKADQLAVYGYPGIFLIALLANATVFLPAPGVAVVFAMGGVFNPLLVALAAATGAALGELTGYLAGFSGQGLVEHSAAFGRIAPWVSRWGALAILVFAALPNPFFDVAGVAAGMFKMPLYKFLPACWAGQIVKMLAFAYAGAGSLNWFQNLRP